MNSILLPPIIAGTVAQIIKFLIKGNYKKLNIKNLIAYSGMPSGHSAMVISLSTTLFLTSGFNSAVFAISIILAIIVIRDALGIRRYLGQHGKTLNILLNDLSDDNVLEKNYPHLLEKIGHTPIQVLVGSLIGFTISLAFYFF